MQFYRKSLYIILCLWFSIIRLYQLVFPITIKYMNVQCTHVIYLSKRYGFKYNLAVRIIFDNRFTFYKTDILYR